MLAPLPDLKQFQRLGLLKFPRNISPLMLYYATSSKFRQPAWCPVDLCQTLKKRRPRKLKPRKHWPRKHWPRKLKPRKHWPRKHLPRKRSLCITSKALRLLCKQFSLCYFLVIRAIGWATESLKCHPKFSLSFPFFGDFFFFLTPSFFFAIFFVATSPSRLFLSWLCRDSFVATFTVGSKHNTCGKMASSATDDALKEVKWP